MVLPKWLRLQHRLDAPGEVDVRPSPDGLLLTPVADAGRVEVAPDGLPVLRLGRAVTNEEVLAAIDDERSTR